MSGLEIAGVVLAILPLIISAVENYKTTSGPLRRWKKYDPGVKRFQEDVFIQEEMFRNQCHILISSAAGWDHDMAEKQLNQEVQYGRGTLTGAALDKDLNRYLGRNSRLIYTLMVSINEDLALIKKKSEGFDRALDKEEPASQHLGESEKRVWFAGVRKKLDKLDFAFSERHFKEALYALQQRNQALIQAMNQLQQMQVRNVCHGNDQRISSPSMSTPTIGIVRQAAVSFCEALTNACNHQHSVYFGLTPRLQESSVHFDIALRGFTDLTGGELISDIVRFSSKSTLTDESRNLGFLRDERALDSTIRTSIQRKRALDTELENLGDQKRTKLRHSMDDTRKVLGQLSIENNYTVLVSNTEDDITPLSSEQGNLCKTIRGCIGSPRDHRDKAYLGHISTPPPLGANHELYASRGPHQYKETESLGSLMREKSGEGPRATLEVFRLAKQLASAVLYFQGTPILPVNWTRENIVFFSEDESQQDEGHRLLKDAYVNFNLDAKSQSNEPRAGGKGRFPNYYTPTLGQILHELGHRQTGSRGDVMMAGEGDIHCLSTGRCDTVTRKLGSRYMVVLRRCIDRFGEGIDFSNVDCQAEFERGVVLVLGQIASALEEVLDGPFA